VVCVINRLAVESLIVLPTIAQFQMSVKRTFRYNASKIASTISDKLLITVDGRVDSVAINTKPMSEKINSSKGFVQTVLELKGGVAVQ